jgi:hypothetical protein
MKPFGGLVVLTNCVEKGKLDADREALAPAVSPVPLSEAECGLPTVLSVTVTAALLGPNWLGVKMMLMVQLVPAAKLDPQVLV